MATKVFHVRWSSIRAFRRCQKKYEYSWIQKLVRRKPAVPLVRGSMIGECLDQLAAGNTIDAVMAKYEKAYGKLFREEKEEYGDILGEVRRIIKGYQEKYAGENLEYLTGKDGKPYEIEVETRFTLEGTRVLFTGHIDKLVRETSTGNIYVMDHKTHKKIPDEAARFNDLQLITYLWLLPLSGYEPADGVIWDYANTTPPTVPELLKNGTLTRRKNLSSDYDTYLKAIEDNNLDPADYEEELARLKKNGNDYYLRVKLPHPTKELVTNMVSDFKLTILEMRDAVNRGGFVRSMSKECSWCEYYNLCAAEVRGLDSSFMRKADYMEKTDD